MKRFRSGSEARCLLVMLVCIALVSSLTRSAHARESPEENSRCADGKWSGWGATFNPANLDASTPQKQKRIDTTLNIYNSAVWWVGAFAVETGTDPPNDSRWSRKNSFDKDIQDGLRISSRKGRRDARGASDYLMAASILVPVVVDTTLSLRRRDCDETASLLADWSESLALTSLIGQSTKSIFGRKRPNHSPDDDSDSLKSFFSGHASMAAAGAGVTCSHAIRRKTYGLSRTARVLPCALGATAALTTGMLRIAGDKHWATDVLVGWVVGGLVGYFDTPGPFDLLRFRIRGSDGRDSAEGVVLPTAADGIFGARLTMRWR